MNRYLFVSLFVYLEQALKNQNNKNKITNWNRKNLNAKKIFILSKIRRSINFNVFSFDR